MTLKDLRILLAMRTREFLAKLLTSGSAVIYPPEEPKGRHADDLHLFLEEDDYPAPSRMKKLVAQAKLDARYQPSDMDQLKRDYDKHVRSTLRDPKHADAHKRE